MNICKIASIKPDGKPWESQYGPMYPFYVVFQDGAAGTVNSKTETPPYKVGDEVGYEITGKSPKGVPKLKIDRKADPAHCTRTTPDTHPDLEAATQTNPQAAPRPATTQKPQASSRGLDHYSALYASCVGAAGTALHGSELAGDREALRQVATAFFIQALKENIQPTEAVPF